MLNGKFGSIQKDTHPDDVVGLLGDPTHRYDEDNGATHFLYNSYEVGFWDNFAMYVQNHAMYLHLSDRQFKNDRIQIDPWIFDQEKPLTKSEIIQDLEAIGADYRHVICNRRRVLQMGSGVILDFNPGVDDPEKIVCDAIWLSFPNFPDRVQEISG